MNGEVDLMVKPSLRSEPVAEAMTIKVRTCAAEHYFSGFLRRILVSVLTLYVLVNSRRPIYEAVNELTMSEMEAAKLVSQIIKIKKINLTKILRGSLSSIFCFVPVWNKSNVKR